MNKAYQEFLKKFGAARVFRKESMSKHTYFKIGGPADLYFEPKTVKEFAESIKFCIEKNIPYFVIGGGANVLFSDYGYTGIVIRNRIEEIKIAGISGKINENRRKVGKVFVQASSGTLISRLARYSIDQGLGGLEFLISVPGTLGAGLKINAHFRPDKNEFIGNCLHNATLLGADGKVKEVDQKYFNFNYDYSALQITGDIVLQAIFSLIPEDKDTLWQRAKESIEIRTKTQPLNLPSSGCVFRNMSIADARMISTPNNTTSSGYLIDKVGLKGKQIGNAKFSDVHANYIVNLGEARASDVLKLINLAKEEVKNKFNIDLKEEVFLVGEF